MRTNLEHDLLEDTDCHEQQDVQLFFPKERKKHMFRNQTSSDPFDSESTQNTCSPFIFQMIYRMIVSMSIAKSQLFNDQQH